MSKKPGIYLQESIRCDFMLNENGFPNPTWPKLARLTSFTSLIERDFEPGNELNHAPVCQLNHQSNKRLLFIPLLCYLQLCLLNRLLSYLASRLIYCFFLLRLRCCNELVLNIGILNRFVFILFLLISK